MVVHDLEESKQTVFRVRVVIETLTGGRWELKRRKRRSAP